MISFFDNIYYWFFRGCSRIRTERGFLAEDSAATLVSLMQVFNGGFAIMLICAIIKTNILNIITGGNKGVFVIGICVLALALDTYSVRYYKGIHNDIIKKFEEIDRKARKKQQLIFFAYCFFSFGLFFGFIDALTSQYVEKEDESELIEQYQPLNIDIHLLDSTKIMQYKDSVK